MRRIVVLWMVLGVASAFAGGDIARKFAGRWITDSEMAVLKPVNVFGRQLERMKNPARNSGVRNRHILFRKTFDLARISSAKVYISADDYYKLYLNGRFVGQGPAAGTIDHTWYNEIDVTGFLRPGRNVLAVHTYYQGYVNRVWVSGDDRHGLILDLVADGKAVVASDASFRTAVHRAFSAMGISGNCHTQVMECYDAGAPEVGFESPDFDDSKWSVATIHPHGGDYRLFAQPTAMLEFEDVRPVKLEMRQGGVIFADFGGVYVGDVRFVAKGTKGAEIVYRCGQEVSADGTVRHKMRCNCDYVEKFVLSGGARDELASYDYKSFQYVEIVPPKGVTIERDSIVLRARHLPFSLKAQPNCADDPDLMRIWKLCADTFHYGVQEQIQDCMDREKGYYLGDGVITLYSYCLMTKDWAPARKFFDDFLRTRSIDRGLVTCACCSFMQEIADYPFYLILFVRQYLEETGDVEFVRARFAAFSDIVASYRERYAREDGLLCNLDKWCVVEWPANFRDGYDANLREGRVCTDVHNVINAWYVGAVKTLNAIAERIGERPFADAVPLEAAFRRVFWDDGRKLFVDREGSRHVSLPGNAYSAFFALDSVEDHADYHLAYLKLVRERGYSAISFYQYGPLFSYLRREGEAAYCRELIKSPDAWMRMLREGATRTYEGWGRDTKRNTSLFHLTMAGVAAYLCDNALQQSSAFVRSSRGQVKGDRR